MNSFLTPCLDSDWQVGWRNGVRPPHPPNPALELPPLTSPSICGIPGFPFVSPSFLQRLEALAGLVPGRRASSGQRGPSRVGGVTVPSEGELPGDPRAPLCALTFICFAFFLFTPTGAHAPEVGAACVETQADMCGDEAVSLT